MSGSIPADSRELAGVIQGAKLVVLPGAGHLSCGGDPAAFDAAVSGFLDRTVRGAK
jgi:pimeloyl-ACP methyl ester carboxylesterase